MLQLQKEAYDTKAAYCIAKAQTLLRKETFRLVLLDVNLPDGEGFSVLQWMNRENLHIPVLFSYGKGSGRRCPAGI